jgi:hypothetical protein
MKKVVPVVALVVLVAAVALVMLRPGSGGGDPARPGGLVDVIGGLLPSRNLVPADVQGQPCWDEGALVVPPGATCVTPLPDAATRMRLCTAQGLPDVRVAGASYGPQRFKPAQLDCSDPGAISLYDDGSRLLVVCLGTTPCVLKLV